MTAHRKAARNNPAQRRGASLLSYGLLVGLISVVALVSVTQIGSQTDSLFSTVGGNMATVVDATGAAAQTPETGAQEFDTVGNHSFTVPASVTTVTVKLWGGGGSGLNGGYGGYTEGTVPVSPGQVWTAEIGGLNQRDNGSPSHHGAGGGRAAFWLSGNMAEVLVAGGGGGSTGSGSSTINRWNGGDGGGSSGGDGQSGADSNQSFGNAYGGTGASSSGGGTGGGCDSTVSQHLCPGENGSRISGGNGSTASLHHGSAVGDGYFGGGQGGATGGSLAGGGGGSGFVASTGGVTGSTHARSAPGYNEAERGTAGDPGLSPGVAGQPGKIIIEW